MNAPKFMSFEELARDHERLSAEVEALKKKFEEHVHDLSTTCIAASIVTTEHPKKVTEEKSQRPGKCMDCGKIIEPGHVICRDCIPF